MERLGQVVRLDACEVVEAPALFVSAFEDPALDVVGPGITADEARVLLLRAVGA